jgi:hypothetical protein
MRFQEKEVHYPGDPGAVLFCASEHGEEKAG